MLGTDLVGSGALARAQAWRLIIQLGWGRLEEWLAIAVRGIGPFVAIGAPTEQLPQLEQHAPTSAMTPGKARSSAGSTWLA